MKILEIIFTAILALAVGASLLWLAFRFFGG